MALILDPTGETGLTQIQQQKLAVAKKLAAPRVSAPALTKLTTPTPPKVTSTATQPRATSPVAPQPAAAAPAPAPKPAASSYAGLNPDQYRQSLIDAVKGGVMSEYEANAAIIKNNLARALSDLDAEMSALEPAYQKQVQQIAQNQFTSQEASKELMNQAGWNTGNSGLAVGEQTKIGIAADKSRAETLQNKTMAESDIMRRRSLANDLSGTDLASIEAQKNAKLSAAEAEALVRSEDRNRSIYESDRDYSRSTYESDRQFEFAKAQAEAARRAARSSGGGGGSSSSGTAKPRTASQSGTLINGLISKIESAPTKESQMAAYQEAMGSPDLTDYEKDLLIQKYGRVNQNTVSTFYNP